VCCSQSERDCAGGRFDGQQSNLAAGRHLDQPHGHLRHQRRHSAEHSTSQQDGKQITAHFQPLDDRRRCRRQLHTSAHDDVGRNRIARVRRVLNNSGDAGNRVPVQPTSVHGVNQFSRIPKPHVRENQLGQQRPRTTAIELAYHGVQRRPANPEAPAFISKDIAPPARSGGTVRRIPTVGDRTGTRHNHHARKLSGAGHESNECVVDNQRPRLESDSPHNAPHRGSVCLAIDSSDPQTDGDRLHVALADRLFHQRVQNFLDLEFARRLQVCPGAARLRHDMSVLVRKQTDGLRSPGVDAQHVHSRRNGTFGRVSSPFTGARAILTTAVAAQAFPAATIEVGTAVRPLWRHGFGTLTYEIGSPPAGDDTIFDLASLTKVMSTVPLVMRLVERGGIDLDDRVTRHLPAWRGADRESVTIRDLLSHSSGLPAHEPFYLTLHGRAAFERAICTSPLEYAPRTRSVYSDLGFMLLGFILANVAPLEVQFDALREQMQNPEDLQFHPPDLWRARIAPTRLSEWRHRLLVGEVDDDNAWALGGAAGHSGLFGSAAAVGAFARHVMQVLDGRIGAFQPDTVRQFVARREDVAGSSRGLGWDTMLPTSSCGTRMSAHAFGHTGFTGTSLWIDPEQDTYVVLLTNRVYPDASSNAIQEVRRAVHDAVMREVAIG